MLLQRSTIDFPACLEDLEYHCWLIIEQESRFPVKCKGLVALEEFVT